MKKIITLSLIALPLLAGAHVDDVRYVDGWHGMMGLGWGGFWFWLMALGALIWLGVGALLLVWLWKQINKK